MKKVFLVLLFFCFFCTVHAYEVCSPSQEYIEYTKMSDEEKSKVIEPLYCEEIKNTNDKYNEFNNPFMQRYISATATSSYYNAKDDNIITTIKNQHSLGTCWAFSALSVIETNALKQKLGTYDFSESHVIYSLLSAGYSNAKGKANKYNVSDFSGGKVTYPASYFFNSMGQLLESDWKYVDNLPKIKATDYKKGKPMISVSKFVMNNLNQNGACSVDEIKKIKEKIIANGSVQSTMYMDESLFKDKEKDYYLSTKNDSYTYNHGVTIIGWDDTISKTKFNGATRDGAWIIKNSWGNKWSKDGIFYISYDDNFICKRTVSYSGVSKKTFENTYKAADLVGDFILLLSNTYYVASKFEKQTTYTEKIKRISFPLGENMNYKVYLSKGNNIATNTDWQLLDSGRSDEYSISSVDLSNIKIDSDFTIIVEYKVDSDKNSSILTMCNNKEDTSHLTIERGNNYISTDRRRWSDMQSINLGGTDKVGCEPNIYVYTDREKYNGKININVKSFTNYNDGYKFVLDSNIEINKFTYKIYNSSNKDVTSNFKLNVNNVNKTIDVTPDNTVSGLFTLKIMYNDVVINQQFRLSESVSFTVDNVKVKSNSIIAKSSNYRVLRKDIMDNIVLKNTSAALYDNNNNKITNEKQLICTNYKLKTSNKTFNIVVIGDLNEDGKISALDYIQIKKHIMGQKIKNKAKLLAADLDDNSNITALDYIAIKKIILAR